MLDREACYKALQARDERFDGRLFVGVSSTGVYCRPVCPARPPKLENCRFFLSAAAAQEGGFRPCLRCRPEKAPESGPWRGTSTTVSRGLALIAAGELDGDGASVDDLAERLGVGARQLRRLFEKHLGASPVAVAQVRRVLFAKQLIHETTLPMSEVAFASGFGSVRRYNETFRHLFHRPPSALRGRSATTASSVTTGVTVRLGYRPPYDWEAMLAHLQARAIEGIERVAVGTYWRTIRVDGEVGTLELAHEPGARGLAATIRFPSVRALPAIVARVRHAFDLAADVGAIGAHLASDPMLAPLVAARPGLRVPAGWDGFELAVRAVLGQQISVAAARTLAGRLVRICRGPGELATFPTAEDVAHADLEALPMPGARRKTLTALARAAVADPRLFQRLGTLDATVARLRAIPGVGEWTAQYIALRAAREPDAFPATDLALVRHLTALHGAPLTPHEVVEWAERWRPWRAYAAQHLYAVDAPVAGSRRRRSVR